MMEDSVVLRAPSGKVSTAENLPITRAVPNLTDLDGKLLFAVR